MELNLTKANRSFDKINALIGGVVFLFVFIVYRMTVAPTLSFWDCGEFIACSYILGVPHPPGSPLFILMGRIFSMIPIASDICLRVNLFSVVSSAVTSLFGYLLVVRIIRMWYTVGEFNGIKRVIAYLGGITGALFMAFSITNWSNSVEAEVYGPSMMVLTIIFWLAIRFYTDQGTPGISKLPILISFLAMLGVGIHLGTFLIMPVAAIFLVLKKDAPPKAWFAICAFFIIELFAIIILSDGRGEYPAFILISLLLLAGVAFIVYKYINWPILIGIGALSLIMVGFYQFVYGLVGALVLILIFATKARKSDWRTGLLILLMGVIGFSCHLFIPIRSELSPRIDENNASRDFTTFVNYLERKQYGSTSMTERMFKRRGTLSHQFGRHAHMGFWSYFEEQYGMTGSFRLLFLLGLLGIWYAIKKRLETGMPFLIFLLLSSAGLILYMNFADGVLYNPQTTDAYLEVRNRDYFFTPAFIYFGLAMGLGVAAIMEIVRMKTSAQKLLKFQKPAIIVLSLLTLLPLTTLSQNYYFCDRSKNYYPYTYSHNILQSCEKDAILFTSGDNDTFPLWCVQEVYGLRKDVRVVNLSLFNTDWYVYQMKWQYDVPISLTKDQIVWESFEFQGQQIKRPKEPFRDRPRKRWTYLVPSPHDGRLVKLQDMMVDEVIIENNWRYPIFCTSEPYVESPLKLRDLTYSNGLIYRIDKNQPERKIDVNAGDSLFKKVYKFDGLNDPTIFRGENATGVMLTIGFNAIRLANEYALTEQMDKAKSILEFSVEKYPEFYQTYVSLASLYRQEGDTAKADSLFLKLETVLTDLVERNPSNQFYKGDLGLTKHDLGKDEEALKLMWAAFEINPNSGYAYRKLVQFLFDVQRMSDIYKATKMFSSYKINLSDPMVRQIMGQTKRMP